MAEPTSASDVAEPGTTDEVAEPGVVKASTPSSRPAATTRQQRSPDVRVATLAGKATARYVSMSPTKVRRVIDLIRGMPATEAGAIMRFDPHAASEPVGKLLASAVANAEHLAHQRSERLDPDDLVVTEAFVDEGPTAKRFRPRAQGRAYRIRKRTSHITIVVTPAHPEGAPSASSTNARRAR